MSEPSKGYWVVASTVANPDQHQQYAAAAGPALQQHGARFLVRGGALENPEGTLRPRIVVIEFPSYAAALACYHSDTYQAAIKLRVGATEFDLAIVEGYAD